MIEFNKEKLEAWLKAIRLRTLPLALSSTVLGSFIAASEKKFYLKIFFLSSITTILLQILSNLANDYGDFVKGTDKKDRLGPDRMVQSGRISPGQMVIGIILVVILSLISGTILIFTGTPHHPGIIKIIYFIAGIAAITAAIKYTVGRNPYGYQGLGDVFVFIFFGLVGVIGTYYLHTHHFTLSLILPAASIGLLSAGVLNLNNLRDYQSDKKAKKVTLVVILGNDKAKIYHLLLIAGAIITGLSYTILNFRSGFQFLFLIPLPMLYQNVKNVFRNTIPLELNSELKKLAFSTLVFSFTFGLGLVV